MAAALYRYVAGWSASSGAADGATDAAVDEMEVEVESGERHRDEDRKERHQEKDRKERHRRERRRDRDTGLGVSRRGAAIGTRKRTGRRASIERERTRGGRDSKGVSIPTGKGSSHQQPELRERAKEEKTDHLSGVKVLHGLDKVLEGGAVVMTLKDQSILADREINEEADMLENIEIREQKQRDDAYKAATRKRGTYYDKFNEDSLSKKSILSHYYDDPMDDEGVTLDEHGRFIEAEMKLYELRKRIEGGQIQKKTEDLTSTTKVSADYLTPEDEMLLFKKTKKKKCLRKKEKLDLDVLEAEAIAAGLGAADLGSRKDSRRQSAREEEQKADAEKRSSAYQAAIAKAEEASKALRQDKTKPAKSAEEEELFFVEDYEDLQKYVEHARKLALRKQKEASDSVPLALAEMATANKGREGADATGGDAQQNKVVFTEMEEFVWGLQLSEGSPANNDANGLVAMEKETLHNEKPVANEEEDVKPEVIHEVAVGKGLAGALNILKERGSLNEGTEWGGRTADKKKSKLVGIEDGPKDIRIERLDEFGRVMTPKEAFRDLSHRFHGKGPGKMKLEKRQKKYEDEMKTKRMSSSDTPLMAAEKMRVAQARSQTPFLVLSGNAKTRSLWAV